MFRSASAVLFALVVLSMPSADAQRRREVSKEMRSKLFKQVLADFQDIRECLAEEKGNGMREAEENMSIDEVDLNRDGVPEYEVQMAGGCACGNVNCSIYLYRSSLTGFESLLDEASGYELELLKTASNGYADVQVTAHDSAATQARTIYRFDGKHYREARSLVVNAETGESKPAYRRVQFKRGMSSTTVQGKASLILPDMYLIGAREGQVMTVQLSAARQAIRFTVMNSTTSNLLADNVRSWTGTLPATGDYHIIVEADERGGTYTMTIGIK